MDLRNKQTLGKLQINGENWQEGTLGIAQSPHLSLGKGEVLFWFGFVVFFGFVVGFGVFFFFIFHHSYIFPAGGKRKRNQTVSRLSDASLSKTEYGVGAPYQTSAKILASSLEVPTYD